MQASHCKREFRSKMGRLRKQAVFAAPFITVEGVRYGLCGPEMQEEKGGNTKLQQRLDLLLCSQSQQPSSCIKLSLLC